MNTLNMNNVEAKFTLRDSGKIMVVKCNLSELAISCEPQWEQVDSWHLTSTRLYQTSDDYFIERARMVPNIDGHAYTMMIKDKNGKAKTL